MLALAADRWDRIGRKPYDQSIAWLQPCPRPPVERCPGLRRRPRGQAAAEAITAAAAAAAAAAAGRERGPVRNHYPYGGGIWEEHRPGKERVPEAVAAGGGF